MRPRSDIWSADTYGSKVAPFVAKLTSKIVYWLDPQPSGMLTRDSSLSNSSLAITLPNCNR